MKEEATKIEQRLESMKNFYMKVGEVIDALPDAIPESSRTLIKETILGDRELKKLMEGLDARRPPRIFLIGRTGVGKSSFINALCGAYIADVSDVRSCTNGAQSYTCKDGDRTLMEIFDTRGISESEALDDKVSAEEMLLKEIDDFSPDVAILMLNCTHRDDVGTDVEFLKKVTARYEKINKLRLPIVVVVNKCDEMAPARIKIPSEYSDIKIQKIQEAIRFYKGIIVNNGLKIEDIVGVSSLMEWKTSDGVDIDTEAIKNLPEHDVENLQIAFDGRYNIDELIDVLENAIVDFEARAGLRMAARLNEVVMRVAKHLIKIMSGISATVAMSPIPVSDIYVLIVIQAFLVALIALLSGKDVSFEAAKEFIFGMGGIAGTGYTLRLAAQQATKLLNVVWPGSGSAVSSAIAFSGTYAIGSAAIAYYLEGKDAAEAKKEFMERISVSEEGDLKK